MFELPWAFSEVHVLIKTKRASCHLSAKRQYEVQLKRRNHQKSHAEAG